MHIPTSIPNQNLIVWGLPIVIYYIATVLVLTAVWVFYFRARSLRFLATAMFFPGLFALAFLWLESGWIGVRYFLSASVLIKPDSNHVFYSLVAVALNVAVIFTTAAVDLVLGLARRTPPSPNANTNTAVHSHNRALLEGFVRAAGEELGWRCYMLPRLLASFSLAEAVAISGVAWGFYHVPILLLLHFKDNCTPNPNRQVTARPEPGLTELFPRIFLPVASQFLCMCCSTYLYVFCAVNTHYYFWIPSLMHFSWNQINPAVTGSLYTNTHGWLTGPQWLINGEGLMGAAVSLGFSGLLYYYFPIK